MSELRPLPDADDLARRLIEADQVHRTVLEETLNAAEQGRIRESGRTVCGKDGKVDTPLDRFPSAVELQSCPRQLTGVWHTHITRQQLRDPEHSLPDIANVVFGAADASMVVGTDSGEVMVAADNREEMVATFEDVLGFEMEGPGDIVDNRDKIEDVGRIHRKLRAEFDRLIWRVPTGYLALESRIDSALSDAAEPSSAWACAMHEPQQMDHQESEPSRPSEPQPVAEHCDYPNPPVTYPDAGRLRHKSRRFTQAMADDARRSPISIQEIVIGQTIGTIVGNVVDNLLFQ